MTVDALLVRMGEDAQARIAALRAAADAEVAALQSARAAAASLDVEQTLAARRATRQAAYAGVRALAQRQASARLLTAQHGLLDQVFARAAARLEQAGSDARYLDALPAQMAAVVAFLGPRPASLRCAPEFAARLRPLLAATPQLEVVADAAMPAGFVAATHDGRCTIDATLAARLAALRPQLEADLLAQAGR